MSVIAACALPNPLPDPPVNKPIPRLCAEHRRQNGMGNCPHRGPSLRYSQTGKGVNIVRQAVLCGAVLGLTVFGWVTSARADVPPMPPCPPGWEQVDKMTCREPFHCPPGWKLDTGPVCVPWECQKTVDCSWKGFIPCKEADVCVAAGGGRAVSICESGPSGPTCPSGLSCQKRKLCASFAAAADRDSPRFANWTPGSTPRSKPPAPPTAASPPTESPDPPREPASASPPPSSPRAGKGGCQLAATPAPSSLGLIVAALFFATRRRQRSTPRSAA